MLGCGCNNGSGEYFCKQCLSVQPKQIEWTQSLSLNIIELLPIGGFIFDEFVLLYLKSSLLTIEGEIPMTYK